MSETAHKWTDFAHTWTRGRDMELDLTAKKTQAGVTSALDLTGGVIWVTGKRRPSAPASEAVFRLNSDGLGGVAFVSAEAGTALATILASHTVGLPQAETVVYVEGVWVKDGKRYTFLKGTITFEESAEEII